MDLVAIAEKHNGELVGGCVVAEVDGVKRYIVKRTETGEPVFTEWGLQLGSVPTGEAQAAEQEPELEIDIDLEPAKRRGRKPAAVDEEAAQ